ncbi:MAG: extracellular solute-binding protein [Clostridia bacterium]|nr:extracellular solute-binding protein [Clostridia bacterium]
MFKFRRIAAFLLALVMLLPVMAGCGKKSINEGIKDPAKLNVGKLDDSEIELSIFFHIFGYCVYDDEWQVFTEAAKRTGVTLKGTSSEMVSDSAQAFTTMLMSDKLPDIVAYNGDELKTAGMDGVLIPLEGLIEEYAPNIKKFMDENPEARAVATAADGHIYYIPGTAAEPGLGNIPSMGWFIRQDWLEKLGLETPKTVDELYTVYKAFRDKDPNGNGQKDEIPYFSRNGFVSDLYQLWGANNSIYVKGDKFVAGYTEDSTKTALVNMAKWYKEGLIDKEIFTRGGQAREQLLSSDKGGSTHDWFSSTSSYNSKYANLNNKFVHMTPPADVNGVIKEYSGRGFIRSMGWGISVDNEYAARTMKYFDYWFTEEGMTLHSCGVEGVHYNVVDGKKVFTDEVINAEGGAPSYLRNIGANVEVGCPTTLDSELATMHEIGLAGYMEYLDNKYVIDQTPTLSFTEDEQEIISLYMTDIQSYVGECEQKWILGSSDINADWDGYVAELKNRGLDEVLKVYNAAYDRYKAL